MNETNRGATYLYRNVASLFFSEDAFRYFCLPITHAQTTPKLTQL